MSNILKSGDHLVGKNGIYIVLPHLNGHNRFRLYNRKNDEYAGDIFSFMDYTPLEEIAKHIGEEKIILIQASNIGSTPNWSNKIEDAKKELGGLENV